MTIYLSVGANQIQTWLAQTPQLVLMRGASKLLHFATSKAEIGHWLMASGLDAIAQCAEVGDVDGVVVLTVSAPSDVPQVAHALHEYLTDRIHGLSWSGWWVEAPSYPAAVSASKNGGDVTVGRLMLTPHLQDVGLVQSCHECRREPATFNPGSHKARPGLGCQRRQEEAHAERDAWEGIPGRWPQDFTQLAREGGLPSATEGTARDVASAAIGRRESRNHLATIVADGNNIGGVFDALRDSTLDLVALELSAAELLNQTMPKTVLAAAAATGSPKAGVKVVIPHYVGGDDVTVSVPAPQGWVYAAALGIAFDELRRQLGDLLEAHLAAAKATDAQAETLRGAVGAVSLGIGICFAHASHPFAEAHRRADAAMAEAKRWARGRRSAIGWVDLTIGGGLGPDASPALRGPIGAVRVLETTQAAAELAPEGAARRPAVFSLPPSARAVLWDLLRSAPSMQAAAESVANWDARMGGRLSFNDKDLQAVAALPGELSRARWWPAAGQEEQ